MILSQRRYSIAEIVAMDGSRRASLDVTAQIQVVLGEQLWANTK
jgi:hypothetical protein